jgi:hypothetical protein
VTTTDTSTISLKALRWPLVALFGALLADLFETLVDPVNSGVSQKVYTGAAHEGRMIASVVALLLTALVVPAVWGLTRPLTGRGRILGRIAACLALLGALGHAALSMLYLVWIQVPKGEADRAAMIALLDRITNAATTGIVVPLFIAFPLAFLALYGSYVRARIASRWILVPVVAAPLCAALIPAGDAVKTSVALVCLLTAAVGVVIGIRSASRRSAAGGTEVRVDSTQAPAAAALAAA